MSLAALTHSINRTPPPIPCLVFVWKTLLVLRANEYPQVLQLAAQLAARLARGEVMYLHCWGGHGRTGTVVCIMLHLMYGLSADEAMERCQHVHDVRRIPISVGSPQTEAQRQQVRRVIGHVVSHRQSLPPTPPPPQLQQQQHQQLSAPSLLNGGSGSSSVAPLSPDKKIGVRGIGSGNGSGIKSGTGVRGTAIGTGAGAAAVGGRRGWVRGRRQAFAQAPNGVGEEVSGWMAGEDQNRNGGDSHDDHGKAGEQRQQQDKDGIAGNGSKWTHKAGASGAGAGGGGGHTAARTSSSGALASSPGLSSAGTVAGAGAGAASSFMPRRKSFTEPYSEEDPSRGTRMSRLRRKSAPGKPPADVLAPRVTVAAAEATAAATAAVVVFSPEAGKEDCCDDGRGGGGGATKPRGAVAGGSLSLSPENRNSRRHSKACSAARTDASVSPGSCTGVERCVTRSSGGGGAGAGHSPSPCGGNGASCRTR